MSELGFDSEFRTLSQGPPAWPRQSADGSDRQSRNQLRFRQERRRRAAASMRYPTKWTTRHELAYASRHGISVENAVAGGAAIVAIGAQEPFRRHERALSHAVGPLGKISHAWPASNSDGAGPQPMRRDVEHRTQDALAAAAQSPATGAFGRDALRTAAGIRGLLAPVGRKSGRTGKSKSGKFAGCPYRALKNDQLLTIFVPEHFTCGRVQPTREPNV
jgi:hypothetical protein